MQLIKELNVLPRNMDIQLNPDNCYVLVYDEFGKTKRWVKFDVKGNNKYDPDVYY